MVAGPWLVRRGAASGRCPTDRPLRKTSAPVGVPETANSPMVARTLASTSISTAWLLLTQGSLGDESACMRCASASREYPKENSTSPSCAAVRGVCARECARWNKGSAAPTFPARRRSFPSRISLSVSLESAAWVAAESSAPVSSASAKTSPERSGRPALAVKWDIAAVRYPQLNYLDALTLRTTSA